MSFDRPNMHSRVRMPIIRLAISLYAALCVMFGSTVHFNGNPRTPFPDNFSQPLTWENVGLFAITFIVCFAALWAVGFAYQKFADKHPAASQETAIPKKSKEQPTTLGKWLRLHKRTALLYFLLVIACWLPAFLNFYPGTSMNDQLYIILDPINSGRQHPIIYNLILSAFVEGGSKLLGSANAGYALYVLLQMIFCAAAITFCACWMRYRFGFKIICTLLVVVYAISPIVSNYSISTIKDTPYSFVFVLWVPFLIDMISNRDFFSKTGEVDDHSRSHCISFMLLLMVPGLLRNNGIYISIVIAIIIIIASPNSRTRLAKFAAIAIGSLICFNLLSSAVSGEPFFREKIGIPLQQISAVACMDADSIDSEDLDYIQSIIPIESLRKCYCPMTVDTTKFSSDFNNGRLQATQDQFWRTYFSVGATHPDIYFRAFLSNTWGNWDLSAKDDLQSYFLQISGNSQSKRHLKMIKELQLHNHSLLPEPISAVFTSLYEKAVDAFPGPGLCFFLLILLGYLLALSRGRKAFIVLVPFVLLWATLMIATPLSTALRYVFPILLALPLLAGVVASDYYGLWHSKHHG